MYLEHFSKWIQLNKAMQAVSLCTSSPFILVLFFTFLTVTVSFLVQQAWQNTLQTILQLKREWTYKKRNKASKQADSDYWVYKRQYAIQNAKRALW